MQKINVVFTRSPKILYTLVNTFYIRSFLNTENSFILRAFFQTKYVKKIPHVWDIFCL